MDNQPMCGCAGCDLVNMGRQIHGQIAELRDMIDSRDKRLNEIYMVAGNMPESVQKSYDEDVTVVKRRY